MKAIIPLFLAWVLTACEKAPEPVPMTPWLAQSIEWIIASTAMLCAKRSISPEDCEKQLESTVKGIRKKVDEVCKDYPEEKVECTQYWLEHLMDIEIMKNIQSLNAKDV